MSLREWKKTYYPVPADQIKTQAAAVDHSILKWSGLRSKVLQEYGVERYESLLYVEQEDRGFVVATKTCALCCLDSREVATPACTTCPLYKSRGNVSCAGRCDHEEVSPYAAFTEEGDPEPMLIELHKAKAWLEGGNDHE